MCEVCKAIKAVIKENSEVTDLELSTVAVKIAAQEGVTIGSLWRVGTSVSIEIGSQKEWFSL